MTDRETIIIDCNAQYGRCDVVIKLKEKLKIKQSALEEIEEIVEKRNYLDYSELLDDILDIINKTKGEGND